MKKKEKCLQRSKTRCSYKLRAPIGSRYLSLTMLYQKMKKKIKNNFFTYKKICRDNIFNKYHFEMNAAQQRQTRIQFANFKTINQSTVNKNL
jgi:hypothetical protein